MPANPTTPPPPGRGFLGWLGRQVGHVRKAVHTDPAQAYERTTVAELPHPLDPRLTLRRTTVDQVVVGPTKPTSRLADRGAP